jgi:uncharacterized protein YtpQ (UPF0354 family)
MLLCALPLVCALVASASGCGGDGSADVLPASSHQETVVAGLEHAGFEAEALPGPELRASASEGPNRVDLALDDAFAAYEEDPGREDEIVAGVVADAEERLQSGLAEASFDDVRQDLMPLLEPQFGLRNYGFEPAQTPVPGNLSLIYVVDADDSFTVVRPEDVERWGTTVEELESVALGNLLTQTNEEEKLLCEPSGGRELCGWSSGDGYDATRMLVPELRRQIVREYGGPAVYTVPMSHVFVALPLDLVKRGSTEEALRLKVQRDFQTSDDPVSADLFVERGGELALWK